MAPGASVSSSLQGGLMPIANTSTSTTATTKSTSKPFQPQQRRESLAVMSRLAAHQKQQGNYDENLGP
eukprot:evm.model.NODE_26612_length_12530_cov_19.507662.4